MSVASFLKRLRSATRHVSIQRRRKLRATSSVVESLEDRQLLTSLLSADEQFMLELINRARMDPAAEAARQGISLNEGLAPGTISSDAKQPLAPNNMLHTATAGHSQDMLDRDFFSHVSPAPGSTTFDQRIENAGYAIRDAAENLAIHEYHGTLDAANRMVTTQIMYDGLYESPTHRINTFANVYHELGVGVRFGQWRDADNLLSGGFGKIFDVGMATQNYATRIEKPFITGVVFTDASDGTAADNAFYTPGEQAGSGGTITARNTLTGATFSTTIGAAGGYSINVPAGTYVVSTSGGSLPDDYVVNNVVVGEENIKVDFETTTANTVEFDFGDAPDSYGTLLASDGARHAISGLFLGSSADAEADGLASASAAGDDSDGTDDENGLTATTDFRQGEVGQLDISVSADGFLNAWVDIDKDGDFDADEQIATNLAVTSDSSNEVEFAVPSTMPRGNTFVRLRLTADSVASPSPTGVLETGEVEDHRILIRSAVPTVLSPGATTTSHRPTIIWTEVPGITQYEVWLKNESTGVNPYLTATSSSTSYTPDIDLGVGRYNLWVRAIGIDGSQTDWSQQYSFNVTTAAVVEPIERFQPTHRPELNWNAVPGADRYDIWISDHRRGISEFIRDTNLETNSFTSAEDMPIGQYRMWVRPVAEDGATGRWSKMTEFFIVPPPEVTKGQNPIFDQTPTFQWRPQTGADNYAVFIRNRNTGETTLHETNITNTLLIPTEDLPEGPYRWWAIGVSPNGVRSQWTAPMDIYIGGRTDVLTPIGTITDTTPTITWRTVDETVRYDLWVDHVGVTNQVIRDENVSTTSFTAATPLASGRYRIWVRAISVTGDVSPWSLETDFTIS